MMITLLYNKRYFIFVTNSDISIVGFFYRAKSKETELTIICPYNPNENQILNHLKETGRNIDASSSDYNNLMPLGDFAFEPIEQLLKDLCLI